MENMKAKTKKQYYLHEKTMKSFLKSYLLVFFIPVVLILAAWFWSGYTSVQENNRNALQMTASQTRNSLDNEIKTLINITTRISINTGFLSVAQLSVDQLSEKSTMDMFYISDYLQDLFLFSSVIKSILIYLPQNDYCISATRALPNRYMLDESTLAECLTGVTRAENWMKIIELDTAFSLIGEDLSDTLIFRKQIPNLGKAKGVVIIPFKLSYILSVLTIESDDQVLGAVYTADGTPLIAIGETIDLHSDSQAFQGSEGVFSKNGNVYSYAKLKHANEYIVFGLSGTAMYIGASRMNMLFALVVLAAISIFAVLSFHFSIRNYNPIRNLCSLTPPIANSETNVEFDAYANLRESLMEAVDIKREYESSQQLMSEIDSGSKLYAAMRTARADELLPSTIGIPADSFDQYDWVCVKVVLADRFSGLFRIHETVDNVNLDWMPLFADCFAELAGSEIHILPMLGPESVTFLLCMQKNMDLTKNLHWIRQLLLENYTYETEIVISSNRKGTRPFHTIFKQMTNECNLMLESDISAGKGGVLLYENVQDRLVSVSRDSLSIEKKLSEKLYDGKLDETLKVLIHLEKQLLTMKAEKEKASSDPKQDLLDQICRLVDEQYTSPNMSVSWIAEQVGRNIDYVSRNFSAHMNVGLLDYIHYKRISHAKKILEQNPNMTVGCVAEMLGYITVDSFIRVFKKIVGTTPGNYHDSLKGKK